MPSQMRAQAITRDQIMEARELLEVKISGLAAKRATAQDIEVMQSTIEKMARGSLTPAEFSETDVAFHNLLARAAENPLFLAMANSIFASSTQTVMAWPKQPNWPHRIIPKY
jgi:GntR family transcriptional regulator, transcriptional repressor for pyruvate dehydrogenase complex